MPCTMICLTPVIIAAWPAIMSYVAGAAVALGLTAVSAARKEMMTADVKAEEVEIEVGSVEGKCTSEVQQFVKDGVTLTVKTNEQGRLVVCAKADLPKDVLMHKAHAFAGKLQQAYAYHKAMTQLHTTGFNVVNENVGPDDQIHVTLRRW
jgi:hypothetical protein